MNRILITGLIAVSALAACGEKTDSSPDTATESPDTANAPSAPDIAASEVLLPSPDIAVPELEDSPQDSEPAASQPTAAQDVDAAITAAGRAAASVAQEAASRAAASVSERTEELLRRAFLKSASQAASEPAAK